MRNEAEEAAPRWLLMGATGRLGGAVLRRWAAAAPAATVTAQSRDARPGTLRWAPLDAPPPARRFDAILCLSGAVPGPRADLSLNTRLALAALDAARASGAGRLIVASSAAVYGPGRALSEEAPCAPATAYGAAKQAMENALAGVETEVCCLRIGNVAGADALLGGMGETRVRLDRFADGAGPLRSYIGPETLADVLAALMHAPALPRLLNIAAPEPVGMADLLRAAGRGWDWVPAPAAAVQEVTLDCRRLAGLVTLPPDAAAPDRLVAEARRGFPGGGAGGGGGARGLSAPSRSPEHI